MSNKKTINWLKERKKMLTASDIGAVLGLSPFRTNLDVYIDKVSSEVEELEGVQLQFGHDVETAIANMYAYQTGFIVKDLGDFELTKHPDFNYIGATLDRTYQKTKDDKPKPLELKSVLSGVSLEAWVDNPPLYNQIQVQTQCACTGADEGRLVGLFLGYRLGEAEIKFNSPFWDSILPVLDEFWNYNVKNKIPPCLIEHKKGLDSVKKLYPISNGNTAKLLDKIELVNEWESAKKQRTELNKTIKSLETNLRSDMKSNEFGDLGDGSFLVLKETHRKESIIKASSFRTLRRKIFK